MATKKASTTSKAKKAPSKAAASAKTTTKVTSVSATKSKLKIPKISNKEVSYIVLAEIVGTFVLTSVATLSFQSGELAALIVGLTLAVLVLAIGLVSGAHVNPAVTFGLWSVGKVKASVVPVYWAAQFLGALLAIVVINGISGATINLDFGHFTELNWSIVGIEFVAAAVFLFGLVSVVSRKELHDGAKAFGIGLSLFIALVVGTNLYNNTRAQAISDYQATAQKAQGSGEKAPEIPRAVMVTGVTANPAVATAVTETSEADLGTGDGTAKYSRLGLEVIIGTLLGAALGANLARIFQKR